MKKFALLFCILLSSAAQAGYETYNPSKFACGNYAVAVVLGQATTYAARSAQSLGLDLTQGLTLKLLKLEADSKEDSVSKTFVITVYSALNNVPLLAEDGISAYRISTDLGHDPVQCHSPLQIYKIK